MNRKEVSAITRREREAVLMRVVAYRNMGAYPYRLTNWERKLIASATPDDWEQAARFVDVQHRIFETQLTHLEELLGVVARHPEHRIIVNGFSSETGNPESHAWLVLPDGDRQIAFGALRMLGWTEPAM